MLDLTNLLKAIASKNWYALAAFTLMIGIQYARKNELRLWTKTPVGYRFLWPIGIAGVTAFIHGFSVGESIQQAGLDVLNSLWQIALPAMGFAAALKESPLPWDGGAGGTKPNQGAETPPSIPEITDLSAGFSRTMPVAEDVSERPTKPPPST